MKNINRREAINLVCLSGLPLIDPKSAAASMPIPATIPLKEYIEKFSPLIFSGFFEGMRYISKKLGTDLYDKAARIPPSELRFIEKQETGGAGFMEINRVKLLFARPEKLVRFALNECALKVIYINYGVNFNGSSENDVYYRNLLKTECIFFLTEPGRYGENSESFPAPLFSIANVANWSDAKPLPLSDLKMVSTIAENSGYRKVSSSCKN